MFGIDKDAIKKAFVGFHQRLAALEADTNCQKEDQRIENLELLVKELGEAFI